MEGADLFGESLPALVLVMHGVAGGEAMEVRYQELAIRQAIYADLPANARGKDLLSPAEADTEQLLEGGAIHPGVGKVAEVPGDFL
jgi:hypothetical protein